MMTRNTYEKYLARIEELLQVVGNYTSRIRLVCNQVACNLRLRRNYPALQALYSVIRVTNKHR